jgi:hypothetical protein
LNVNALSRGRIALRDGVLTRITHFKVNAFLPTFGPKALEKPMLPAIQKSRINPHAV